MEQCRDENLGTILGLLGKESYLNFSSHRKKKRIFLWAQKVPTISPLCLDMFINTGGYNKTHVRDKTQRWQVFTF